MLSKRTIACMEKHIPNPQAAVTKIFDFLKEAGREGLNKELVADTLKATALPTGSTYRDLLHAIFEHADTQGWHEECKDLYCKKIASGVITGMLVVAENPNAKTLPDVPMTIN